jgi:putative transcriptional regulator
MTIAHHPAEELLMQFASGAVKAPFDIPLRAHIDACVLCQKEAAMWEGVGGALLEAAGPVAMKDGALESALSAIEREGARPRPRGSSARRVPGLPAAVQRYRPGIEFPIGPGIYKRNLWKASRGAGRAFLLRAKPGFALPRHGHSGVEITYVIQGGYSDEHGHYTPGDFFAADASLSHRPRADDDGECTLLMATDGLPQAPGWIGLLMRLLM